MFGILHRMRFCEHCQPMKRLWLRLNTIIMVFDKSPKGKGVIIVLPLIGNPCWNTYERQLLFIPMIRNTNHSPLRGMGGGTCHILRCYQHRTTHLRWDWVGLPYPIRSPYEAFIVHNALVGKQEEDHSDDRRAESESWTE